MHCLLIKKHCHWSFCASDGSANCVSCYGIEIRFFPNPKMRCSSSYEEKTFIMRHRISRRKYLSRKLFRFCVLSVGACEFAYFVYLENLWRLAYIVFLVFAIFHRVRMQISIFLLVFFKIKLRNYFRLSILSIRSEERLFSRLALRKSCSSLAKLTGSIITMLLKSCLKEMQILNSSDWDDPMQT